MSGSCFWNNCEVCTVLGMETRHGAVRLTIALEERQLLERLRDHKSNVILPTHANMENCKHLEIACEPSRQALYFL